MNLVELELDETLADFEVQDWIDNVFSVQYPDIKARIKKGCSGLCHKKNEWHSPDEHIDKDEVVLGIIKHCNKLRFSLVQWNGEWWYKYGTFNAEVKLITWVDTPEVPNNLKESKLC